MTDPRTAYLELLRRSREIALLGSCSAVLSWDQQTFMPPAGTTFRGEQLAFLAGLSHQKATDPLLGELLTIVESSELMADPSSVEAGNIRELRHHYDRAVKLPQRLVEELARVTTLAQQIWQQARATNDFRLFQPHLEQILALKREEADAIGFTDQRYDALLDEYEPGLSTKTLQILFADLTAQLVPLIQRIQDCGRQPRREIFQREFPADRQRWFAESAAAAIGFDFQAGRLDTSTHPFCSGFGPGDCRITTRYNPHCFSEAFFSVLHEAGHGMYEQGLSAEQFGTPSGSYCSLGIHESQSRLWENQVGRSEPFWEHFYPRLQQAFPTALRDVSRQEFYFAINEIRPSYIRVEADEATYNLHIVLRFEVELDLLSGNLAVTDLPAAWNDRFRTMFGMMPTSDREGCLQDVHWSFGGIGYFPTYTLGNLYAAQFMEAAHQALPELNEEFRRGIFSSLKFWLSEKIYRHGRRFRAATLCRDATHQELTAKPFLKYLHGKAASVYNVC